MTHEPNPDTPDAEPNDLPFRLVSRLTNEFHVSGIVAVDDLGAHGFDRAIVFLLLMRHGLPDWSGPEGVAAPAHPTRFGSISALGRSLDRPRETVRRHVAALVDLGLVTQDERGIALATTGEAAARVTRFCELSQDLLVRMVEDIAAGGGLRPLPPAPRPLSRAALLATALDLHLMPFELYRGRVGDWTSMIVWGTIGTANIRHVMRDPVLSRRYAVEPTPDALRVPVSLNAVARAIRIPYATAWRHATQLADAGLLVHRDDGWIVTRRELHRPEVEAGTRLVVRDTLRRIDKLRAEGLDAERAGDLYLHGRPPLVSFGDR